MVHTYQEEDPIYLDLLKVVGKNQNGGLLVMNPMVERNTNHGINKQKFSKWLMSSSPRWD